MRIPFAHRASATAGLRLGAAVGLTVVLAALVDRPTAHKTPTITRVSVSSSGAQGTRASFEAAVSADGRIVAFSSEASNLVRGDTNRTLDVFAHDRRTRKTTRVSVSSAGVQADGASQNVGLSADGRFVAFSSVASNMVPGDTNRAWDVFVHDRRTGRTTRVSVSSTGAQASRANAGSFFPAISVRGGGVAFSSYASNLVRGDTNRGADVFVHDRRTGRTSRVSVRSSGAQANRGTGIVAAMSAGGRFVAFESAASNLVRGDTNRRQDIFVHDRRTGRTSCVSVSSSGAQANRGSFAPELSARGRVVTFWSEASNLVAGDTNGASDVFVHDRVTGKTRRVSVSSSGVQGRRGSFSPDLSASGRFVSFESLAPNLVARDTNGTVDAFLHDRVSGKTTRVSVSSGGAQGNRGNLVATMSADGRFVALGSRATNLVPEDTNRRADVFVRGPLR